MHLKNGDGVELKLGPDEYVAGEVVETNFPDIFSAGWTILCLITEGGHPRFGQVAPFAANEITYMEEVSA
ncbi:MAG: hypothetical protein ACTH2U_11070 [Brevibacterium sp.]